MTKRRKIATDGVKWLVVLGVALLLSACSQAIEETSADVDDNGNEVSDTGVYVSEEPIAERSEQADQENREMEAPDLFGSVKSILGNEVVLAIATTPSAETLEEQRNEERQQKLNETAVGGTPSSEGSGTAGGGGGTGSGGSGGGAGGGTSASGGTNVAKGLSSGRPLELTGEEVTLMIPVGISIQAPGVDYFLDIGDIFPGSILQIWLEDDDPGKIIQVKLIQGR